MKIIKLKVTNGKTKYKSHEIVNSYIHKLLLKSSGNVGRLVFHLEIRS